MVGQNLKTLTWSKTHKKEENISKLKQSSYH